MRGNTTGTADSTGFTDFTDATPPQVVGERRAGERPARKRAGRAPAGACAREARGTISGSGKMTLPFSTLLPMFGFARAAGPNHWPKERSACNFFSLHRFLRVIPKKRLSKKNRQPFIHKRSRVVRGFPPPCTSRTYLQPGRTEYPAAGCITAGNICLPGHRIRSPRWFAYRKFSQWV